MKGPVQKMKQQAIDWEHIYAYHNSEKELMSRVQKNSQNPIIKKEQSNKKWVKDLI